MKILVTGGAGYIGSVATEQLIHAGQSVVVFDNLYQGHREAVHPQAAFVQGDLADAAAVDAVFAAHQPEAVMHFASHTLVGESMQDPFRYLGDNVTNALNLLRAAVTHGVRRFILSSTANLFDAPQQIPIAETEAIVPGSPYGESKYIIERFLHWMDRIDGLRFAALTALVFRVDEFANQLDQPITFCDARLLLGDNATESNENDENKAGQDKCRGMSKRKT